jgi:hypothetical protein
MFHISEIAHSLDRCGHTDGHGSGGGWGEGEEEVVVGDQGPEPRIRMNCSH